MRKNISSALAGFLAALLLWCLLPVTAEAAGASFSGSGSVRAGDSVTVTFSVSGSNIQGITAVLHYDSSTLTLTGAALQAADLNGDGQVTITDMIRLQAYLLGRGTIQPN